MKRIYLAARFTRDAECVETGKRQTLFNYQKDISDKIKNAFVLPLRSLRLCGENSGFSLLEVLVAMAVMVVIVIMVSNMFRDASEAWDMGTQRAEMNTSARAAIGYISRELSCAMAGSIPDSTGGVATIMPFVLTNGNELSFVSFPENQGVLSNVYFKFDSATYTIVTAKEMAGFQPYTNNPVWPPSSQHRLLITNVWRFQMTACSNESDMAAGGVRYVYDSSVPANSNLLPACVDISIEMLSERDMKRALNLKDAGADYEGYVMTNSRVYTTRVCFPNRGGNR